MSYARVLARRALRSLNVAIPIKVGGKPFKAPVLQGFGMGNRHDSEPWMTDVIRRLLQVAPPTGFMDIGVNLAQTLYKLRSVDLTVPYIGFEPNPFCVRYANEAIRMNGFERCEIIPIGLSDRPQVCEFFALNEDDAAGSIVEGLRPGQATGRKQYVPVFPLDDVRHLVPEGVTIVKIDVEGAELEVLQGMSGFLRDQSPWVTCEVLHSHTAEQVAAQGERNQEMMRFMQDHGYTAFQIVKTAGSAGLRPVDKFGVGVFGPNSATDCDYLLAPAAFAEETARAFT